ncbi:MAG: c-type cytochrome [Parashewanella sp.]
MGRIQKKITRLLLSFILTGTSFMAFSGGEALYKSCIACHGVNGEGNKALHSPKLAGQPSWYLIRQLENFQNNYRGSNAADTYGLQMAPMAKLLESKQDIAQVAQYISSLPSKKLSPQASSSYESGYRHYQAKCGACHGGSGEGNKSFNAPRIAGQHLGYLKRQMAHFKKGIRGYHKQDKYGRQMAMMSRVVTDKELADILAYVSKL